MPGIPLLARLDGHAFHTFTRGLVAEIGTACEALIAVSGAPYVTDLAGDADGVLVGGTEGRGDVALASGLRWRQD